MATLTFNGQGHTLSIIDDGGRTSGVWTAYNNTDSHATLRHIPDGTYIIQDTLAPHWHPANANGPYGLYGVIRFNVPNHAGIAVHSGRASSGGPLHPTMGCIRTSDTAMKAIKDLMSKDHLSTITVIGNSKQSSTRGAQKYKNAHLDAIRQ